MEIIITQTGKCHHPDSLLITKCHLFEGGKKKKMHEVRNSKGQTASSRRITNTYTPLPKGLSPKQQNPLLRCGFPMTAMPFSLAFSVQDIIISSNDRFNPKPNRLLTSTSVSQTHNNTHKNANLPNVLVCYFVCLCSA